jgi:FkbM family methyltransferase
MAQVADLGPTSISGRILRRLRKGQLIETLRRRLLWRLRSKHDRFLDGAKGVIHVGANAGQERHVYALCQLPVIWIEPIPETFAVLKANIEGFPRQRALQYLVTDKDGDNYDFHVASNNGASSSIMAMNLHREVWPSVEFTHTIRLQGTTLPTLLQREAIDASEFDVLVMDTQGSELLVLRGAEQMLCSFRYIFTEAADFDAYSGGCLLADLGEFLRQKGFVEHHRAEFARHSAGGRYYNVLFRRADT